MKNLKFLTTFFVVMLMTLSQTFARQYFDKNKDLLVACFDLKPDEDDVHSAAALACMLKHSDLSGVNYYAVAGAYGEQGGSYITSATPGLYNTLFGAQNQKWTDAHGDRNNSLNRVRDRVKNTLNAGGKVFIAEAGQSNFTYDMLQRVKSAGVSASVIKSRVIVVQHSQWNEDQATDSELNWVKSNTDYNKIADGNSSGNGTPGYNTKDTKWLNQAKSSQNANAKTFWTEADRICDNWNASWDNPNIKAGGVDYSDNVEIWWIFNIGTKADNISKFWSRYVTNSTGGGNVAVTGVDVTPATVTLTSAGATQTLSANVSPSNATNKTVNWSSNNNSVATVNSSGVVTAVANGTATITARTADQNKTDNCIVTVNISSGGGSGGSGLVPIHDAYLQGTTRYNNNQLRVEAGKRISYLMFDLSSLSGTVTKAQLKLKCEGDAGNGSIKVEKGNNTTWTESNLSSSNKPASSGQLGTLNTNYAIGSTYTWNLTASSITTGGKLTLILTQTSGNDVSFGSKESSSDPQLIIETSGSGGGGTCEPSVIKPYVLVDDGSWEQNTNITVESGKRVRFGPHPTSGGSWSWSGCGISGSNATIRDPNIYPTSSCSITATHTNSCGAKSSVTYNITVTGGGGSSNAIPIPGKVEAENYTAMNGIQTQNTSDAGGGKNVGWIGTGDWMDYKVNVQTAGSYTVKFRVASLSNNIKFDLKKGGTTLTSVNSSTTGGWQTWKTVTKTINLTAGEQTLRILATGPSWNINYMDFAQGSSGGGGTGSVITVQAESFNTTGGTFNDGHVPYGVNRVNGVGINWVNNGDWAQYNNINIPQDGAYEIVYYISSPITGSTIDFSVGNTKFNTTTVPNNGQWDSYQALKASNTANFTAGNHNIKLTAGSQDWTWNLDKFTLQRVGAMKNAIEEVPAELSGFNIYPNPATDVLTIQLEETISDEVRYILYNTTGRILSSEIIEDGFHQVSLAELVSGVYIIQLRSGNEVLTKKIIKE